MDSVLATPNIGYATEDLYRTFRGDAAAQIARWLEQSRGRKDGRRFVRPKPKH